MNQAKYNLFLNALEELEVIKDRRELVFKWIQNNLINLEEYQFLYTTKEFKNLIN
jgi:hypothetical protein